MDVEPSEYERGLKDTSKSLLTFKTAVRQSTVHRPYTRSRGKVEDMEEDSSDDEEEEEDLTVGVESKLDDEVNVTDAQQSEPRRTEKSVNAKGKRNKAVMGTLLIQLELFSKFKNPKSIHRESELRELYFDVSVVL